MPRRTPTPARHRTARRRPVPVVLAAVLGLLLAVAGVVGPASAEDTATGPGTDGTLVAGPAGAGFDAAAVASEVLALGGAPDLGSMAGRALSAPIVGIAATPSGRGYWLVASDGGIFSFGDAQFLGSTGAIRLNRPIVGIAATPSGRGYWLVASDGGVFAFGDAQFFGSTGSMRLNRPVVGMAATPSGRGYWLVASDGGIFAFGDAPFLGSAGSLPLVRPVVGMSATPDGRGYWMVASDGGVFAYGDATFLGRTSEAADVVAVAARQGGGYATVTATGVVTRYGTGVDRVAPPDGTDLAGPAVGLAASPTGGVWVATGRISDVVTVFQGRELSGAGLAIATEAARTAGARITVLHSGTLGLVGVSRGGAPVQTVTPGWRIPMTAEAVPPETARAIRGADVGAALARGEIVMSATSAALRGAQPGDDVDVLGWDGDVHRFRIGLLAPDAASGSELLLSDSLAASIGFSRPTTAVIWGFASREAMTAALPLNGPPGQPWRVRTSWDAPDPDRVLPQARLKRLLGEFEIRGSGDPLTQQASWREANIVTASIPLIGQIRCHRVLIPAIQGAMQQIVDEGLAGLIDLADSRSAGGCYNPREIRSGYGTSGRTVSRHGWGAAIDINPRTNAFGATPTMDMRIVAIFRSWGFAWGGAFTIPDGMHFEYVGEPR